MKKLCCLMGICVVGFGMLLAASPYKKAEALTPPLYTQPPRTDYFTGSCPADEFVQWFRSAEAKTQNDGAFAKFIDAHSNYGYLLVPYIEGSTVKPSVSYDSDAKYIYQFTTPDYTLETKPLYTPEDKKYIYSGIDRYIKDKMNIPDFRNEYIVDKMEPGYPVYKYSYDEKTLDIGGNETKCVACKSVGYSSYGDQSTVISESYSIMFIYDGMMITIDYKDAGEENSITGNLKSLKFQEEVLNQANYDKTKNEIKYAGSGQDIPEVKEPSKQTPEVKEPSKETAKAEKEKASVKIIGKKTVKCGKTYKYKAKLSGVSGKVKWSVDNKKLAKVLKSGKLKASRKGTVKLTAKVKKCKCTVKINIV